MIGSSIVSVDVLITVFVPSTSRLPVTTTNCESSVILCEPADPDPALKVMSLDVRMFLAICYYLCCEWGSV